MVKNAASVFIFGLFDESLCKRQWQLQHRQFQKPISFLYFFTLAGCVNSICELKAKLYSSLSGGSEATQALSSLPGLKRTTQRSGMRTSASGLLGFLPIFAFATRTSKVPKVRKVTSLPSLSRLLTRSMKDSIVRETSDCVKWCLRKSKASEMVEEGSEHDEACEGCRGFV